MRKTPSLAAFGVVAAQTLACTTPLTVTPTPQAPPALAPISSGPAIPPLDSKSLCPINTTPDAQERGFRLGESITTVRQLVGLSWRVIEEDCDKNPKKPGLSSCQTDVDTDMRLTTAFRALDEAAGQYCAMKGGETYSEYDNRRRDEICTRIDQMKDELWIGMVNRKAVNGASFDMAQFGQRVDDTVAPACVAAMKKQEQDFRSFKSDGEQINYNLAKVKVPLFFLSADDQKIVMNICAKDTNVRAATVPFGGVSPLGKFIADRTSSAGRYYKTLADCITRQVGFDNPGVAFDAFRDMDDSSTTKLLDQFKGLGVMVVTEEREESRSEEIGKPRLLGAHEIRKVSAQAIANLYHTLAKYPVPEGGTTYFQKAKVFKIILIDTKDEPATDLQGTILTVNTNAHHWQEKLHFTLSGLVRKHDPKEVKKITENIWKKLNSTGSKAYGVSKAISEAGYTRYSNAHPGFTSDIAQKDIENDMDSLAAALFGGQGPDLGERIRKGDTVLAAHLEFLVGHHIDATTGLFTTPFTDKDYQKLGHYGSPLLLASDFAAKGGRSVLDTNALNNLVSTIKKP